MANKPKVFTELDGEGNSIYHIRAEHIRPNELLYDKNGYVVAIKVNNQIKAVLGGDE